MQAFDLPKFEATWWPLQMETIPGSGEVITVGVLVRAATGQGQIRQSVQPSAFTNLFGANTGKGVNSMVVATVVEVQRQLDAGLSLEQLELPFGGFHFASPRDCVARDMSEVFDVGVRLSAAFGVSAFGRQAEIGTASQRAFDDWADRVRVELLAHEARIAFEGTDFNVSVKLARKQVRFGIVRSSYAANFGVLRPGQTSGDIRSLKVKVFDLEALRRDQILPVDNADVIVGCSPVEALSSFERRQLDTYRASLEFIESEARARNVNFIRCVDAQQAAAHIRERLHAA